MSDSSQNEPTQKSTAPAPPPLPPNASPARPPVTASTQPAPPVTASPASGSTGSSTASSAGKVLAVLAAVCLLFVVAVGGLAWYFLLGPGAGGGGSTADGTVPLLIDATPWGEVTRITDAVGEEVPLPAEAMEAITPLVLEVPPGEYTVHVRHPWSGAEGECQVRLVSDRRDGRCLVPLVQLKAEEYFAEVGWGKGGAR